MALRRRSGGLSPADLKASIDLNKGVIRMAVPDGKWTISLISELEDLRSKIAQTKLLIVKSGNKDLRVRLIAPE